jgi:hypothetical protein
MNKISIAILVLDENMAAIHDAAIKFDVGIISNEPYDEKNTKLLIEVGVNEISSLYYFGVGCGLRIARDDFKKITDER